MAKKRSTLKKKSDAAPKQLRGRPPTYDPQFHPNAAKALCGKGATIAELADAFDVAISTIWQWKVAHKEFFESCKVGSAEADARVERSYFERAVGYTFDSVKVMQHDGNPMLVPFREHVPPDPRAGEFWLTNRQPDRWKHKQTVEHDTPEDSPLRILAKQLMGTSIRPQLSEPKVIEHDANEQARVIRPQQQAQPVTIDAEPDGEVIEARPVAARTAKPEQIDDADDEPRFHTVSRKNHEEDNDDA